MFVSARFPVSLVAASLAVTLGAVAWTPLVAQNPLDLSQWIPRPLRDSGRPVVPLFEGWFQNEDGTYTLAFGYQSQNLEEDYDIPVGPDNFIEPSQYNGGQPTHFRRVHPVTRRPWSIFTVTVPEDFGRRRVVWTLRHLGNTYSVPGHLISPAYLLDEKVAPARYQSANAGSTQGDPIGAYAPEIHFDPAGPGARGIEGLRWGPLTARVGEPLPVTVWVEENGGRPQTWLWWLHYSGPGEVTFSEDEIEVELSEEGRGQATTMVRFTEPGEYVVLVQAIERLPGTFEFHCCWTNGYVEVIVNN